MQITTVNVCQESPWNTFKSEQVPEKLKVQINPGYAAQDYHNKDWHFHSYSNEQVAPISAQSAESCTSYSMVVGVMVPQDREDLCSCANDSGIGDSLSPGLSSCTEEDLFQVISGPAEPEEDQGIIDPTSTGDLLVLPVLRSANGKLQFFSLAFQPVLSNGNQSTEIIPLVARSTPAGERTVLLTDLVSMDESDWTDNKSRSEYRKAYLPNGVPQSCLELPFSEAISKALVSGSTSNYRENWVPVIPADPLPKDTNCIVSNSQLHGLAEPEEDVDESPAELETTFLSGWMVQIQA